MSYRNDFDAAVARVDALSSENDQLAAENAELRAGAPIVVRPAKRAVSRGVAATVLATLVGAGILAAVVMSEATHAAPALTEDEPRARMIDPATLRACARTLELTPVDTNAKATDPHGAHQSIGAVKRSTGCRDEIRAVLDGALISDGERAALVTWSDAEATLDGTVTMIGEYYALDPYALDGYSTAPQLWTEYNRALVIRNQSLAKWRDVSRGGAHHDVSQ